jgi:hypothetical protein
VGLMPTGGLVGSWADTTPIVPSGMILGRELQYHDVARRAKFDKSAHAELQAPAPS